MSPNQPERLALALAIGFLIGVERGWRAREIAEGGRTAGIRTFALSGLLGGIAGILGVSLGGWAFAVLALPFAGAFVWFKAREQADEHDHSVTAIVAGLLVFALGACATVGDARLAAETAVVVTALLAFKGALHGWLRKLTWPELRSALVLLAMTVVVLPLLPDRGFGPYAIVNPHELWLLTILLAGVSFAAYASVKVLGPSRGLIAASVTGALVSSTAITLGLGRLTRQDPIHLRLAAGCALLASAVTAFRILVVIGALAPILLTDVIYPLGTFSALSVITGVFAIGRRSKADAAPASLKSPFELELLIKLVVTLGLTMAAARAVSGVYGAQGVLPLSVLSGLWDADAITLTVARLTTNEGLDRNVAAQAVLLGAAVNSVSKTALAVATGGRRFGALFAAGTAVSLAGAAVAYALA